MEAKDCSVAVLTSVIPFPAVASPSFLAVARIWVSERSGVVCMDSKDGTVAVIPSLLTLAGSRPNPSAALGSIPAEASVPMPGKEFVDTDERVNGSSLDRIAPAGVSCAADRLPKPIVSPPGMTF